MKITAVSVDGLKGVAGTIECRSTKISIGGPVGAGKSTFIDGLRYVLRQSHRLGTNKLDRFGERWSVSVDLERVIRGDAGGIQKITLQAGYHGKAFFAYNGQVMDVADYQEHVRAIVGEAPTDMAALVAMSERSRSAALADIMGGGTQTLVALTAERGLVLETWLGKAALACIQQGGMSVNTAASVNDWIDGIKLAENAINRDLRTQQANLATLSSSTDSTPPQLVSELEQKIGELQKELGGIQQQIKDSEEARERFVRARDAVSGLRKRLELAQSAGAFLAAADAEVVSAEARLHAAQTAVSANREVLDDVDAQLKELTDLDAVPQATAAAMRKRVETGQSEFLKLGSVPHVTLQVLNAELEALQEQSESGSATRAALAANKADVERERLRLVNALAAAERAAAAAKRKADDLRAAGAGIAAIQDDLVASEKVVQSMANTSDMEALLGRQGNITTELELSRQRVRAAQHAAARAQQVADGGAAVEALMSTKEKIGGLLRLLEEVRRERVAASSQSILAQAGQCLGQLLPGFELKTVSTKTGTDIAVLRNGKTISIDDLSDGQSVLVAAAILPVFQTTGMRMLTMNAEYLDQTCLRRLMAADLGVGFCMVATNRAERAPGWQYVEVTGGRVTLVDEGQLAGAAA